MAGQALSKQQDDHRPVSVPANQDTPSHYAAYVERNDGENAITLFVDGVHCAGCISKIEKALYADPAVTYARLNFSTMRLHVKWKGTPTDADRLVSSVTGKGFGVRPFDPRDLENEYASENRFLLLCLGVAGFAAGNIMLLSFALWSTTGEIMGMAMRDFLHWISAAIAIPAVMFSGRPFFRSAIQALAKRSANMDVPISVALVLTLGMSLFEVSNHGEHVYFDSALMLMFFLLVGRYLDFRARASARSTAGDLLSMMAGTATVLDNGKHVLLPIRDLEAGMAVLVGAGERIPADGRIVDGRSEIDTSLVTGESLPCIAQKGEHVFAGTVNMSAPLTIEITQAAENSLLADIVKLMEQAEQAQAKYVRIADRAAKLYTPVVHLLALLAFCGWFFAAGMAWQQAMMIAVTVLIITCPCALGLAVPVVQVLAIGRLMKRCALVKSGDALERLSAIDTVMFDKTGTLTQGHPVLDGQYDDGSLKLAASLAVHSKHPLARALAASWGGDIDTLQVIEHPGQGLEAQNVRLGSRDWCGDKDTALKADRLELWLSVKGQASVPFYFTDPLRNDARETVDAFKAYGLNIYLVSGDRAEAVEHVADELGIENRMGGVKPTDKYDLLQELRNKGRKVLMVGDGLNDAPVLAGADASMSPVTAIDLAQNAADIVFMGDRLAPVLDAYRTAVFSQKLVKQNFSLAVCYNIIAVPLAIAGMVTPLIAALAMSGSSLIVVANSFRLKWRKA